MSLDNLSQDTSYRSSKFPTRSNPNRPVLLQKMARSLKFQTSEDEKSYYPGSKKQAKSKAPISLSVTAKLIYAFVFALAKFLFSHDAVHLIPIS